MEQGCSFSPRLSGVVVAVSLAAVIVNPVTAAQARDLEGTVRADSLVGSKGPDSVRTYAGNDRVASRAGDDHVSAGLGRDLVDAGPGFDTVFGRQGRDTLLGDRGNDVLAGGVGPDMLHGGRGIDLLFAGPGRNDIKAADGNDVVYLDHNDAQPDSVDCGAGNDTAVYDGEPNGYDVLEGCEVVERSDGPMKYLGSWFDRYYGAFSRGFTVGDQFTEGLSVLQLKGEHAAVINDVQLMGNRGFHHLGTMVIGPGREIGAVQIVRHWPPASDDYGGGEVVPAEGASISPLSENSWGWELLIGMSPTKFGRNVRAGFAISYTVAGVRYRHEEYGEFVVCAKDADGTQRPSCRRQ